MKLYHMSQSLQLGDTLTPDYQKTLELAEPFVQALEQSIDCFCAMVLNGKYLYAVLSKFRMWEWSDYAKWATEGAFEFIRKTEFPQCYGRMSSNYFYDDLTACKKLFAYDWGNESQEEQEKVHLFEVEVDDPAPQKHDMNLYDEAYDNMASSRNIPLILDLARQYYRGEGTANPTWEFLSVKKATATADVTTVLR